LKGLAVTGAERAEATPEIPTLAEAGVEGVNVQQWWGVFAPAGTPDEIVAKINAHINQVLESDETKEFLGRDGGEPWPMTPEEFDAHVDEELQKWAAIAEEAGISAQ
jgi:tripartite-type tricarboxylate transporter receptor subunit TctC